MADFYLPYTGEKVVEILRKVDENGNILSTTDAYNTNYDNSQSGLSATKVQSAIDEIVNENVFYPSLMMFVTNANTNSLDIAFGKNNESEIHKIGKQLAMYAWFKGDSKTTYPFTKLKECNTLEECLTVAFDEIESNYNLMNLISTSPYANSMLTNIIIISMASNASILKDICSNPDKSYAYRVLFQSQRDTIIQTLDNATSLFAKQTQTFRTLNASNNLVSALLNTNTIIIPKVSPAQIEPSASGYGASIYRQLFHGTDSNYKIWEIASGSVESQNIINITSGISMRGIYYKQTLSNASLDPAVTCDVYTVI